MKKNNIYAYFEIMPIAKTIFERFRNSYITVFSLSLYILYEGFKTLWKQGLLV